MALIKYVCMMSIPFLCTCIKGNAIPLDTFFDKLNLNKEKDGDNMLLDMYLAEDTDYKMDTSSIHLLKDSFTSGIASMLRHTQLPYVKHFARHGICSHKKGKQHFYRALKSKLCHIRGQFISELVEDLCAEIELCSDAVNDTPRTGEGTECGKYLYNWVSELFDINGDRVVDHFERQLYEHETDDGCAKCT